MIDTILAFINAVISFNAEYNATHLLPLSAALFVLFIFTVVMPLMVYMMRETPEQTIERVSAIVRVYDANIERVRNSTVGSEAVREALITDYQAMCRPFADELVLAYARQLEAAKKGAKQ